MFVLSNFQANFQILKYILEVTSVRKKFLELSVGARDKETWPDLRYSFEVTGHYNTELVQDPDNKKCAL